MRIHFYLLNFLLRKAQMHQYVKFGDSSFSFWEIRRERNENPNPLLIQTQIFSDSQEKDLSLAIVSTLLCLLIFFTFMALCLVNVMLNISQSRYTQLAFYTQEKCRIERTRCASERPSLQGEVCLTLCQLGVLCFPVCRHLFLPF